MPKFLLISSVFFLILTAAVKPASTAAMNPISGLDDVINSLRSGNAQELARYVDDNIEISLPDKSDSYSRTQAVMVLKDFFANNGVTGFEVQFKGENGGSQFCVGKLSTRSGSYRTTVFMKTKAGRQLVKEIRFQSL
ncbi:MAG TPA: DUF4783 domain-containing protein [Flavisolibacter sp.]|nr:DUF4783 domain-containing protein [Flavisolibacter sp.]